MSDFIGQDTENTDFLEQDTSSSTDFLEQDEEQVNTNVASEVGKVLQILMDKKAEVAEAETALKLLQADVDQMVKVTIPQMFKKHGVDGVTLSNGTTVSTTEELTCSLIKDEERRKLALAWLIDNGGEDLIQDLLVIEQPTPALLTVLNQGGVVYSMSKDVNTNSLKAWFREKLGYKKGIISTLEKENVPKEFGLFIYDLAKIKEPKGRG